MLSAERVAEIRMRCLELARSSVPDLRDTDKVLELARALEAYVLSPDANRGPRRKTDYTIAELEKDMAA